jgi:hypothetical protein
LDARDRQVVEWLLGEDQPSARYRTLLDILDRSPDDEEVRASRAAITKRGWVRDILASQRPDGHWEPNERGLYQPKYTSTNWRMIVLSDLGVTGREPGVTKGVDLYVKEWLAGDRLLKEDREVCILGNFARAMTRFGFGEDPRVKRIFDWLIEDQREDGGWHCDHDIATGSLDCWEALAAFAVLPKAKRSRSMKRSIENGAEFYLERRLFRQGRRYEPWFRYHYPVHYFYDVLLGLDVITSLGYGSDKRLAPALNRMEKKRLQQGTWNLDAIHRDIGPGAGYWPKTKEIKFSLERKGDPSKWITLTCMRVLKRVAESS